MAGPERFARIREGLFERPNGYLRPVEVVFLCMEKEERDFEVGLIAEIEELLERERAFDLLLFFLQAWWVASEEVTVGLAA